VPCLLDREGAARHGEAVTCSGTYRTMPVCPNSAWRVVMCLVLSQQTAAFFLTFILFLDTINCAVFETFRRVGSFPSSGKNPAELGQTDKASDYFNYFRNNICAIFSAHRIPPDALYRFYCSLTRNSDTLYSELFIPFLIKFDFFCSH
jgi:hypothetical protein